MSIILYISTHVFPSCHQQACLSLCLCILSLFFSLRTVRDGKKRERMRGCVFDRHFRSLYDRVLYTLRCSAHHLFSPCNPCCVCCWLVAHFESRDSLSLPLRSFCCPQKPWKRDRKMMNWLRGCCCCCLITPLFTRKEKNFEQNSPFLYWKKKKEKTINKENEIKIKYTKWKIMTAWSRSKRNRN